MGRRPKETFLPRGHTDGQQAHDKMFKMIVIREMQIKLNEMPPHTSQNDNNQKIHKQMLEREGNPPTLLAGV